jgi:outer membrane usher protein
LGRSVATSVPLYVDTRLLAAGLSSYSFEAGFLRRNYGQASFDYQRSPAFSATGSYGLTDSVTVNAHAEGTTGVVNAGAGAYVALGQAGVVNGALSASVGHANGNGTESGNESGNGSTGNGQQFSLGYQLIEPRFAININTLRAIHRYSDVASRAGDPVPISTDRATVSLPFLSRQSLAFSYIGYKLPDGPIAKVGSVTYMVGFGSLLSFNISVFHDFGDVPTNGVFLGMNVGLGSSRSGGSGTSINTNFGRQNGVDSYSVNATSAPDYGGGFGWGVQAGRAGVLGYQQAQAQYVGNVGEATAVVQSYNGHAATSLDLTGAVVFVDKTLLMSRRIDDSFAVVSTDGVGGVPVLHDNRVIGKTSSRGYLLIPDLNAYEHNQISIDPMNLPADTRVSNTALDLVPESHAGVLGHFGIAHFDAATVILHDRAGKPIAVGTPVLNSDTGQKTIVGYDGQTFIESLLPTNHLRVGDKERHCDIVFDYRHSTDGGLHTIGPLRCDLGVPPPRPGAASQ